jgi:uncharacterized protein involved in response to NO
MTAIETARRARLSSAPALLRGGFRPFFLGGAIWAAAVVVLWVGALTGAWTLPTAFDALAWHRHEMLYGYLGAVVAGFLMTAIPNWTGRLPIAGMPLAAFAGLWLTARLAVLFSEATGVWPAAVLDVGFLLVLAAVCGREVVAARNRNLPVVAIVLLLALASALDHAELAGAPVPHGLGTRAGFGLILVLIALIGGRIIPSFTRNWLMKRGRSDRLPAQPGGFDMLAIAATAAAFALWTFLPDSAAAAILLIIGAVLQAARLARWSGLRTVRDPLVFILHVAYAWLPIGMALLGASQFTESASSSAALHALAAGAMASMTLAVMTRASLGHTGRPLACDAATTAIFAMVTLGAAARVAAIALPFAYLQLMVAAGTLWAGAFILFAIFYGPMLARPRADGRP